MASLKDFEDDDDFLVEDVRIERKREATIQKRIKKSYDQGYDEGYWAGYSDGQKAGSHNNNNPELAE